MIIKIWLILLAPWTNWRMVLGASMDGGTVLTDPVLYSHMVQIRKGAPGSGDFKCLGVVLSSMLIYTSNYCELTQDNMKDYNVDASFSNKDPALSSAKIVSVYTGKHMNDFKQVALELPGLEIALIDPKTNYSSSGIQASPFNSDENFNFSTNLFALAYDGKNFKAGKIVKMMDEEQCTALYAMAAQKDTSMPANMTEYLMCATKDNSTTTTAKYEMFGKAMDVAGGTPCDDSLGSPVMGANKTVGIVIKAFCDPAMTVAFVQPIVPPDTGLKPDVPDSTDPETTPGTPEVYTGTYIPVTGLSNRKPRTRRTDAPRVPPKKSLAPRVAVQLAVWCSLVVGDLLAV